MIYKCFQLTFLFFSLIGMTGCHKQGCTDESAINYDVTADQDDGSCIVCHTIVTPLDSVTLYLIDDNSNSIHYLDAVLRCTLRQDILAPSDNHCDKPVCNIYLTIESLLDRKMFIPYRVERETGPFYINTGANILVEAHQIID